MGGVEDGHKSSFIIWMHQFCLSVLLAMVSSVAVACKVLQVMLTPMSPYEHRSLMRAWRGHQHGGCTLAACIRIECFRRSLPASGERPGKVKDIPL